MLVGMGGSVIFHKPQIHFNFAFVLILLLKIVDFEEKSEHFVMKSVILLASQTLQEVN